MITNANSLKCGACGCKIFYIYSKGKSRHSPELLIVECTQCESTTHIDTKPAELNISWGENSNGILCTLTDWK